MVTGMTARGQIPTACLYIAISLVLLCASSAAESQHEQLLNASFLDQLVNQLQTEVAELRQTVALLHGGAALVPEQTHLRPIVGQPFVPQAANTQRTMATRATLWPQYWSFQSAVTADHKVTVTHVMTDRPAGAGAPWCNVLGDAAGQLYFFTPHGHLLFEHDTGTGIAVTALASTLTRSNTTHLAVGLQDGTVLLLALGHESLRSLDGSGITSADTLINSTAADRAAQANSTTPAAHAEPIQHLAFTKSQQRKVLISVDASGQVHLMAQATGRVLMTRQLDVTPLAVNLNSDFQMIVQTPHAAVVVLMHTGRSKITRPCTGLTPPALDAAEAASSRAGSRGGSGTSGSDCQAEEDGESCSWGAGTTSNSSTAISSDKIAAKETATSTQGPGVQETEAATDIAAPSDQVAAAAAAAEESNVLVAATFDPVRPHRVFGVTAGGDLLVMVVPSAQRTNLCKVAQRMPLGLPPGPVRLVATKGRLIVLHAAGVAAFDTRSSVLKLAGSHVVSHTWKDMWRLYGLDWQQQQQQQTEGDTDETIAATVSSSRSSNSGVLHTSAVIQDSTALLAATAAANLLLLPLGGQGVVTFSETAGAGSGIPGGQGTPAGYSSGGSDSTSVDWLKMLQPLVVVMMVGVAVWQFMRASSKNSHMRSRRLDPDGLYGGSGFGGSGLEGLGPSDLGQMGMAAGLFGGGGMSGLDREFGEYAGPRTRRTNRMTDSLLDMGYGGLNAANARRRARQVMHGRGERELEGFGGGFGRAAAGIRPQGLAARQQQQQQGFREAPGRVQQGPGSVGVHQQQGLAPQQGFKRSDLQGSAARMDSSARRVRFENNNAEDSGSDADGQLHVPPTSAAEVSSTGHEDVTGPAVSATAAPEHGSADHPRPEED